MLGHQIFFNFLTDPPGGAKAKCAAVKEEAEGRLRLLEREKADVLLDRGQGPFRPKRGSACGVGRTPGDKRRFSQHLNGTQGPQLIGGCPWPRKNLHVPAA